MNLKSLLSKLFVVITIILLTGCDTIDNPVRSSLFIDMSDLVLSVGESATRVATTKSDDYQFIYSSSNPSVATVDQNGLVTALSVGETIIQVYMPETRIGWYAAATREYKVIVQSVSAAALKKADKATPLTLVAVDDGNITVSFNGGIILANDIHYTINAGEEHTISKKTSGAFDIQVKKGDVVSIYSMNSSLGISSVAAARGMTRAVDDGAKYINIRPSMKTEIYGNVMSLLKGKDNLESAETIEANNAFYGLFADADKLVNNTERLLVLPATTLTEGCYDNMFTGCKGIEKAPELPAPTLVKDCYKEMFYGCSILNHVKCLATDIKAEGSTKDWLGKAGTEATGEKVLETLVPMSPNSDDGVPDGWTAKKIVLVESVTIDMTELTMTVGEDDVRLVATVKPDDASDPTVTWTSSKTAVATVDASGKVHAVSQGEATITATAGDKTATCKVTVKPAPVNLVTNITLPETLTCGVSYSTTYLSDNIKITPDNAADKSVTWSSDNTNVVVVDQNGKITTSENTAGVAHITATANDGSDVSATCTVTVKLAGKLKFKQSSIEKYFNSSPFINELTVVGDGTVSYESSDTNVASVDASTGKVTIAAGATAGQTVTITATASETEKYFGASDSYTLTIIDPTGQGERENYGPGSW